jgi:hypothetical protein
MQERRQKGGGYCAQRVSFRHQAPDARRYAQEPRARYRRACWHARNVRLRTMSQRNKNRLETLLKFNGALLHTTEGDRLQQPHMAQVGAQQRTPRIDRGGSGGGLWETTSASHSPS